MRIVLNTLIVLMLAVLAGGGALHWQSARGEEAQLEFARAELKRFQREINIRAAMHLEERSSRGYPTEIDPSWFAGGLPVNPFLDARHPWLEIAHEDERELSHPPSRVAGGPHHARFWYNPANGRVRARVPASASDAAALRLYNAVNDAALSELIGEEKPAGSDSNARPRRSR